MKGGVFWYKGEGQIVDMKLDKGNSAIVDHTTVGRALHVFQTLGKAKGQRYVGEFTYASHEFAHGPDKEGNDRKLYKAAELAARTAMRGLWRDEEPLAPWDWRKAKKAAVAQ